MQEITRLTQSRVMSSFAPWHRTGKYGVLLVHAVVELPEELFILSLAGFGGEEAERVNRETGTDQIDGEPRGAR